MKTIRILLFAGLFLVTLGLGQSLIGVRAESGLPVEPVPAILAQNLPPLSVNPDLTVQADPLPVFVGIYSSALLADTVGEITQMDTWLGAPTITMAGTFLTLESPPVYILGELNSAWNAGYVPFVNIGTFDHVNGPTAAEIANGDMDDEIRTWATTFRDWSNNGEKRAMLAPLQEANGDWTSYGMDSANFKLAWYRIQSIFAQEGVRRDAVIWVFAPNGWSYPAHEFEFYYPGDTFVDAIGFSSFNFGACPSDPDYRGWETFYDIYKPYLDRMVAMAPTKPIIVAEVGSVEQGGNREQWLNVVLTKFAEYPTLRGFVYFNRTEIRPTLMNCVPTDYRVYKPELGTGSATFKSITTQAPYGHWALTDPQINNVMFDTIKGYFRDIDEVSAFSGQVSPWYTSYINRLFAAGFTTGCEVTKIDLVGDVPDVFLRDYCPAKTITRAEMAVFLERGLHGASYTPPPASGSVFVDVPADHWAAAWIEQLYADGITGGCSTTSLAYCPEQPVTRAQMAVFLLRSRHGASYWPAPATGTVFVDVPAEYWAAAWVEQLYPEGITAGCSATPLAYCPESPNLRQEMAVFLVRTFYLP